MMVSNNISISVDFSKCSVTHGEGSNRIYNTVDKTTNEMNAWFAPALQTRPEVRRYLACRHPVPHPRSRLQ